VLRKYWEMPAERKGKPGDFVLQVPYAINAAGLVDTIKGTLFGA
jgi:hypothetical protein